MPDVIPDLIANLAARLHIPTGPETLWHLDLGGAACASRYWRLISDIDGETHIQHSGDDVEWHTDASFNVGSAEGSGPAGVIAAIASIILGWSSALFADGDAGCGRGSGSSTFTGDEGETTATSSGAAAVTEDETVVIYGCHQRWLDASGAYRSTWFHTTSLSGAQAIADALQSLSNALAVETWIGPVTQTTGSAQTEPYALDGDAVLIAVEFPGGAHEPLLLPAPLAGALMADQITLDPEVGAVADLYALLEGNLWSVNGMAAATGIAVGLRESRDAGFSL